MFVYWKLIKISIHCTMTLQFMFCDGPNWNFTGRFELRSVSKSSNSYVVTVHCEIIRGLLGVSELSAMYTVFLHNPFAPVISQDMLASWLSNQVVIISVHIGIIWHIFFIPRAAFQSCDCPKQGCNSEGLGKIRWYQTTAKQSKAWTAGAFLGIFCISNLLLLCHFTSRWF